MDENRRNSFNTSNIILPAVLFSSRKVTMNSSNIINEQQNTSLLSNGSNCIISAYCENESSRMRKKDQNKKKKKKVKNVCENHPDKLGKYQAIGGDDSDQEEEDAIYYCKKCAILLASKGFQVQQLNQEINQSPKRYQNGIGNTIKSVINHTPKNVRKKQTSDFLNKIEIKIQNFKSIQQQITNFQQLAKNKHAKNNEKIQEFFLKLSQILQKQKQNFLNKQKFAINQQQTDQLQLKSKIIEKLQILSQINKDINESYQNIITDTTPDNDYRIVMQHYKIIMQQMYQQQIKYIEKLDSLQIHQSNLPNLEYLEEIIQGYLISKPTNNTQFSFDSTSSKFLQ